MSRLRPVLAVPVLAVLVFAVGLAQAAVGKDDGAVKGMVSVHAGGGIVTRGTYVISPFESVSMTSAEIWRDNRHRAYLSSELEHLDGFLLFDVGVVPDTETISSMTLRCYLEDRFDSPHLNPIVDVYYSTSDGWDRGTVAPGALSLDVLLLDDVPFTTYVTYYDFELDISAHDWSADLLDDQICIGFRNDAANPSYVYFFGAYGEPEGPPPELTIETGSPVEPSSWTEIKALFR
jgi:hypothetical protein